MVNVEGDSADPLVPAVNGKHNTQGIGVLASSDQGVAVRAIAKKDTAVFATSDNGIGIDVRSDQGVAVRAIAKKDTAVFATSDNGIGIDARSEQNFAVQAIAKKNTAVVATSENGDGVLGVSTASAKAGVAGVNESGGNGVMGRGTGNGVFGIHVGADGSGVVGVSENGVGVFARGGRLAGFFEGDVEVTGDIRMTNADCAEDFNIGTNVSVEPGTVMVLGEEDALYPSQHAYDKRVAGVVSGAGNYKPGIVLDKQQSGRNRQPIALLGKVYCKVNAQYGAIEVGDLLTTSPTPGHAMKADDPAKAFGAIIGKSLRPLKEGQGLIPILIALQ